MTKKEMKDAVQKLKTLQNGKAVLEGMTEADCLELFGISRAQALANTNAALAKTEQEAYTAAMNLNERVGVNEGVFERFKTEILYDMQGAKTSITDIYTRLEAVETALSGVEEVLSNIVEVTA